MLSWALRVRGQRTDSLHVVAAHLQKALAISKKYLPASGQRNSPPRAVQQRDPYFFFQVLHLPGQSRLREMQFFSGE